MLALALPTTALAQQRVFTHADTLRGSNGPGRAWWDAAFYDLHVQVNPADSSIVGWNGITYRVLQPASEMQVDLQVPMVMDSVIQDGKRLEFRRDGNAFFITLATPQVAGSMRTATVYYHGSFAGRDSTGQRRRRGPFHWATDSTGAPWIATSNEGPGASTWWPLKDLPADEPDSQRIAITLPDPLKDISNGRLRSTTPNGDGTTTYEWFVSNPINSYNVAINASPRYVPVRDEYQGLDGKLSIEFWALTDHEANARALIPQVKTMLQCFEHWFGPYPWYNDGYKLIEVPYLGMEHQSGIAYGNRYLAGYLGRDLSKTGEGMSWDYIVVHESAHEWFGNNISARDHADMWIHESFGMYAEALYLECTKGKEAGDRYLVGLRSSMIRNDMPIIGTYGVNDVPSSQDRYPKGANMLMTMRAVVQDDAKWLATLRGLNKTFRHQTVTAKQVRDYMSQMTGVDLTKIFVQYQETTRIPVLEYQVVDGTLRYRWSNVVPGFDMPIDILLPRGRVQRLHPTDEWLSTPAPVAAGDTLTLDPEYYVTAERVGTSSAQRWEGILNSSGSAPMRIEVALDSSLKGWNGWIRVPADGDDRIAFDSVTRSAGSVTMYVPPSAGGGVLRAAVSPDRQRLQGTLATDTSVVFTLAVAGSSDAAAMVMPARRFEDSRRLAEEMPDTIPSPAHADPDSARFITSDVALFWKAVDAAPPERLAAVLQRDYLERGTVGVRDFLMGRILSAEDLALAVRHSRARYDSSRAANLDISAAVPAMRAAFHKLKALYPDAVFPDVYFVVGRFNSGGTASRHGLLIGSEMYRDASKLPAIVSHELIHFQQHYPNQTLLEHAFLEGSADFIGEMISGSQINNSAHEYGRAHEHELWQEFKPHFDDRSYYPWMYGRPSDGRPADLGYFIGYRIAQAYYEKRSDKQTAIADIITGGHGNVRALLAASGYEP